jgi:hypothetical protein
MKTADPRISMLRRPVAAVGVPPEELTGGKRKSARPGKGG